MKKIILIMAVVMVLLIMPTTTKAANNDELKYAGVSLAIHNILKENRMFFVSANENVPVKAAYEETQYFEQEDNEGEVSEEEPEEEVDKEIEEDVEEKVVYKVKKIKTKTLYANNILNFRKEPIVDDENVISKININTKVKAIGKTTTDRTWYKVKYQGKIGFMAAEYLQPEKVKIEKKKTPVHNWNGAVLNRRNGTVIGPSGKETYYNLNMNGCIRIMKSKGINMEYSVREDGVKMYGDYVMVAADLSIRPKGTLVDTSLGMGIVVDTGSFVKYNPLQLDIAVAW